MKRSLAFAVLMLAANNLAAYAQNNECDAILSAELLSKDIRQMSSRDKSAASRAACYASDREAQQFLNNSSTSSDSASGGISFGGFGASGSGGSADGSSATTSDVRRWKENNCSSSTDDDARGEFRYIATQHVDKDAIAAWRECMSRRRGLSCYAVASDVGAEFVVNWNDPDIDLPKIRRFLVPKGAKIIDGGFTADQEIYIGEQSTNVDLEGKGGTISIGIIHKNREAYRCSAYVPSVELKRTTEAFNGDYCSGKEPYVGFRVLSDRTLNAYFAGAADTTRMRYLVLSGGAIVAWPDSTESGQYRLYYLNREGQRIAMGVTGAGFDRSSGMDESVRKLMSGRKGFEGLGGFTYSLSRC